MMTWIASTILVLQILLLLHAAATDIAARVIHNETCLTLALLGIIGQLVGSMHLAESLRPPQSSSLLLLVVYARGWMGGGDVKLLAALAIGLPLAGVVQMLTVTALAGAVLAAAHLMMRFFPAPRLAPAGSPLLAPRLRGRALAQPAPRAVALRGRHRLRWRLGCSQSGTLTMSSALRLSVILVLLLATAALGLIAYNVYLPKPVAAVAQVVRCGADTGYLVAAHPLAGRHAGARRGFRGSRPLPPAALRPGRSSTRRCEDGTARLSGPQVPRRRRSGHRRRCPAPARPRLPRQRPRAGHACGQHQGGRGIRRLGPDLAGRLRGRRADPGQRQGGSRASHAERDRSSQTFGSSPIDQDIVQGAKDSQGQ